MLTSHAKAESKPSYNIVERNKISEILEGSQYDTFFMLDLDNTLFEAVQECGSDQWYTELLKYASTILDKEQASLLTLAIYHKIQKYINVQAVESETVAVVNSIKNKLAVTARGIKVADVTYRQLQSININFPKLGEKNFRLEIKPNQFAEYRDGILYCDGNDKGECVAAFLKAINFFPNTVIMLDDKKKNLESVSQSLKKLEIKVIGYRYSYLDEKVAKLDMQKANVQLNKLKRQLSFNTQQMIEKLKIKPDTTKHLIPLVPDQKTICPPNTWSQSQIKKLEEAIKDGDEIYVKAILYYLYPEDVANNALGYAYSMAAWLGYDDIFTLIHNKHCVDVNKSYVQNGKTPMMLALENGHQKIVEMLVAEGAKISKIETDAKIEKKVEQVISVEAKPTSGRTRSWSPYLSYEVSTDAFSNWSKEGLYGMQL